MKPCGRSRKQWLPSLTPSTQPLPLWRTRGKKCHLLPVPSLRIVNGVDQGPLPILGAISESLPLNRGLHGDGIALAHDLQEEDGLTEIATMVGIGPVPVLLAEETGPVLLASEIGPVPVLLASEIGPVPVLLASEIGPVPVLLNGAAMEDVDLETKNQGKKCFCNYRIPPVLRITIKILRMLSYLTYIIMPLIFRSPERSSRKKKASSRSPSPSHDQSNGSSKKKSKKSKKHRRRRTPTPSPSPSPSPSPVPKVREEEGEGGEGGDHREEEEERASKSPGTVSGEGEESTTVEEGKTLCADPETDSSYE